jgi:hypothetical protein
MPRSLRTGDLAICLAAVVAMIAVGAAGAVFGPVSATGVRASSYSSRDDGAKAAFLVLKELGYDVERSLEPVADITAPPDETVLVLASPSKPPTAQDKRALRLFIEQGGIVVATGAALAYLPELGARDGIGGLKKDDKPTAYRRAKDADDGMTKGAPEIQLAPERVYHPVHDDARPASRYEEIYSGTVEDVAEARYVAGVLRAQFGKGQAIWWTGSTPLLNSQIKSPGHVELLLNTLGPPDERTVLWDEFGHGYQRSFASYLGGTPLPAAGAQLALIAGLAVFTFSRRRGPIHHVVKETRASPLEFVEAMAALYHKAGATRGAVETGRAHLRRRLMSAAQMPASSSDAQLAKSAATRYPIDATDVQRLLAESAAASESGTLSAGRALTLMQELQDAASKVSGTPRSGHTY